jgi:hypothetical protein
VNRQSTLSVLACTLILGANLAGCGQPADTDRGAQPQKALPCPLDGPTRDSRLSGFFADTAPGDAPTSDANRVGNIFFDNNLSNKERGAFVAAFQYLDARPTPQADSDLLRYMGIAAFDRTSVRQWIEARVQYIVPESVDDGRASVLDAHYDRYENPKEIPAVLAPCLTSSTRGHIVMSNVGAMIYLVGKIKHLLYGVRADGIGQIAVTSPRSGILRVGDGLFLVPSQYPNLTRIFHLTTLLHESRHSDGHGASAGFLHAVCTGGDFQGQAACDHNLNGPYEIEAMAIKALMDDCPSCSVKESQLLKILYLDTVSRRIDDAGTTEWADAPEGHR